MSRTKRRRVTRERRARIARMLDEGRPLPEIARACGCGLDAVRQHVRALRESAQIRAVDEWGAAASATADLVEALEAAVLKVRAAQDRTALDTPNYRKLVWMEVYAIRQLMTVRRELAAARKADADAEPEEDDWAAMSPEELVVAARAAGLSDERILRVWPDAPGVEHPAGWAPPPRPGARPSADDAGNDVGAVREPPAYEGAGPGQGTRPDPLPPEAEPASGTCPRPASAEADEAGPGVGADRRVRPSAHTPTTPLAADDAGNDVGAVREPPAPDDADCARAKSGDRHVSALRQAQGSAGASPRFSASRPPLPMPVPPRGPQRLSYVVRGRIPIIPFAPAKKAG